MSLINCKVELKLKRTEHGVSAAAGIENPDTIFNNINIKDTKSYVSIVTLSTNNNKK